MMHPTYAALLAAARSIAVPVGATVEFENGRKHAFLIVRRAGSFRKLTVSHGTKIIKHQTDWVRQNTRRALRELAAQGIEASGQDREAGLDAQHESPVSEGNAP